MIKNKNVLVDVYYLNADVVMGGRGAIPYPYLHFGKCGEEENTPAYFLHTIF
jgi:hypothetical protein